ncbi:MAG: hypothetical protein AB7N76_05485 [Planctomycetota bacterium]
MSGASGARERWIERGEPADEATWLEERVAAGALPASRVSLAAYAGHPAAALAAAALGLTLPRRRAAGRLGETAAIRQWLLGLGDVCAPEDRVAVARRALAVLLHAMGHDHDPGALDELLGRERPWSLARAVAGWGAQALDELGDPERVRGRVRVALAGWALAPGQTPRPYDPAQRYRVGEALSHPVHGQGFVRRAGRAAFELELPGGRALRLSHGRLELGRSAQDRR